MSDDLIDLDNRRSAKDQMAAAVRRDALKDSRDIQASLRKTQEDLEERILGNAAATWHEAAIRARYLIRCYGETAEGQDERCQTLIRRALADLENLIEAEAKNV